MTRRHRQHRKAPTMTDPTKAVALTEDHADRLDFTEDHDILKILANKVFRRAIDTNAMLREPPDLETQAADTVEDLAAAIADLDAARHRNTPEHFALANWKNELSA